MKRLIRQIPNFITSLDIVAGSLAVIFAIDGHLIWAGIFICVAAALDFLDGLAARLLNAYTDTGKYLDSLADVIAFGLAPGAILFTLLEFSMFGKNLPIYEISAKWHQWLILFSSFLIPVCGGIRLARFNTIPSNNSFFLGLPIPANGLLWASFGLMLEFPQHRELFKLLFTTQNLLLTGIFISGMMLIRLPMFSLKFKSLQIRANWYRYLFLLISMVLVVALNVYGLALTIILYILLNLLFYLFNVKYNS